jgi:DNA-binding GntR family transcriptional regulator
MKRADKELPVVKRRSLEDQAYSALREAIFSGRFKGGERLTQADLAARLSTSRIPVRDALKRLEMDGLVTLDERGACHVVEFDSEDLDETYTLRAVLEPLAASLAIPKLDDEEIQHLHKLANQMVSAAHAGDRALYVELNRSFHVTLYEASGWRRLVRIIETLWAGRPPLTPIMVSGQLKRSLSDHRAILAAIDARDVEQTANRLRRHIETAGNSLRVQLGKSHLSKNT